MKLPKVDACYMRLSDWGIALVYWIRTDHVAQLSPLEKMGSHG